jgi:hypothetical protein
MKKIYTAFVALGLALGANAQLPTNGLIHHFHFDGNLSNEVSGATPLVSDSLDYCFDTRVNNLPPAYTKDRKGRDNKAFLLLSQEKSIMATCGGTPKSENTFISNSLKTRDAIALGTGDRAMAFWAKMPRVTSSQIFRFHRINTGLAQKSAFGLDIKNDNPSNITAYTWGGGSNDYVFNTPLDTNWHFFLITVENSTLYLNIDKTLIGSTTIPGLNTSTGQLFIGQYFAQDSVYIDNVMIYNRSLTSNELDQVYADSSIACVNPDVTATAQYTGVSISISNAARPTAVCIKDGDGGILQSDTITSGSGTGNVSFFNLSPNTFYYYTVTNADGCSTTSSFTTTNNPTGVNTLSSNIRVTLYPNPANNVLHISSDNAFEKIQITNVIGNMIKEENLSSTGINIAELQAGVYFAKLIDSKGAITTKKFIKE